MTEIKGVLFFDIDGTLVDSEHHKMMPSEQSMVSIRKAQANGYKCFLASGRNRGGLSLFDELGFDGYVYGDGGGIEIFGELHEIHPIPKEEVENLIDQVVDQYGGSVRLADQEGCFLSEKHYQIFLEVARGYAQKKGTTTEQEMQRFGIRPLSQWNGEDIIQIDTALPDEEVHDLFQKGISENLHYIYTGRTFGRHDLISGEITAQGVTKAAGCARVMKHYGLFMKQAYAFGDSMNDEQMIQDAGVGIVMGNGDPQLKKCADYITDACEDEGITSALKHFGVID